jgi:uncharacterized paraquat-inducible protein A
MRAKHIITRAQVNVLDAFERGEITLNEAALELGRTTGVVRAWLVSLGMQRNLKPVRPHKVYKRKPERRLLCPRCEILLSQAPLGRDGMCGYCVRELAEFPLLAVKVRAAEAAYVAAVDVLEGR